MKDRSAAGLSIWFAATVLLGAFLLFQVQPLFSKMILPWFGGSPAVWTTCLLFFQTVLLAGYAYAHGLSQVQPAVATAGHPFDALGAGAVTAAHHTRRILAALGRYAPHWEDSPVADSARGVAVPAVGGHVAAGAGLVRGGLCRAVALSLVRAVEFRFAGRSDQLSAGRRAFADDGSPGRDLVGGLWLLRGAVRRARRPVAAVAVARRRGPPRVSDGGPRQRGDARQVPLGVVDSTARLGFGPADVDHQPRVPERGGGSAVVDRAAGVVPGDVHPLFRKRTLVRSALVRGSRHPGDAGRQLSGAAAVLGRSLSGIWARPSVVSVNAQHRRGGDCLSA